MGTSEHPAEAFGKDHSRVALSPKRVPGRWVLTRHITCRVDRLAKNRSPQSGTHSRRSGATAGGCFG